MKIFMFIILTLLIPKLLLAQTADQINTDGYWLLNAGNYLQSIEKFKQAVQIDPNHNFAWYNLACAYSLSAQHYYLCFPNDQFPPYIIEKKIDDILEQSSISLKKAIQINPQFESKSLNDPDLLFLRKTLKFYKILNYNFFNPRDLYAIIIGIKQWHDQLGDIIGITINFNDNNNVYLSGLMYRKETDNLKTDSLTLTGNWFFYYENDKIFIDVNFGTNQFNINHSRWIMDTDGNISIDNGIFPTQYMYMYKDLYEGKNRKIHPFPNFYSIVFEENKIYKKN